MNNKLLFLIGFQLTHIDFCLSTTECQQKAKKTVKKSDDTPWESYTTDK